MHDRRIPNEQLIISTVKIAIEAGKAITEIYNSDFDYQLKKDLSPITEADNLSHNIIAERLEALVPKIPILSEENCDIPYRTRSRWTQYWLVDPLDGTKEFIEGVPHFVVSIALVENGEPILGVLYNPVSTETFTASKGQGAHLNGEPIRCTTKEKINEMIILNSRSETRRGLWKPFDGTFGELRAIGSVAYKLGLTAAGKADIFATLRPKNEWDICAGDCIINEAGGKLIDLYGNPRKYNLENTLLEPGLIAGDVGAVYKTFSILKA